MSEQKPGSIALPGEPSNTPGLPSSFQPLFFHTFNGLNTRPGRIACPDQQCYVLDGWMPIAPDDIRILPDVGHEIFRINNWSVALQERTNAQDVIAVGTGAPTIIGFGGNSNFSSGGMLGGSVTVTTTAANEVIVLGIHCVTDTRPAVGIASMTDTASLGGWTQRALQQINYPTSSQNSESAFLWYAKAASPVTTTINFTFSDYVYGYAAVLMHVSNADFASPWDTFGTVIAQGFPPPTQPAVTARSNLANALMFTFASAAQGLADETITGGPGPIGGGYPNFWPPAGFTWGFQAQNTPPFFPFNSAGSNVSLTWMQSLPVIPAQTVQWRYPVDGQGWIFMVDTLTGT